MADSHFTESVTPAETEPIADWLTELHVISESLAFVAEAAPAHCSNLSGVLHLIQTQLQVQLQRGETLLPV